VTTPWKFRFVAFVICLAMGGVSVRNLWAELLHPPTSIFPNSTDTPPSQSQIDSARIAARIAPDRSDLQADAALALAAMALYGVAGYRPDLNQEAQSASRQALAAGPLDSRIWLVLARLQAQHALHDPRIAETLKLSYFTGPGSKDLIPARLAIAVSSDQLSDPDLRELARGDVRLILIRHPELKPALVAAYRIAAPGGKHFLEQSIRSIDPSFVISLPGVLR
jgi:hypothetical protein